MTEPHSHALRSKQLPLTIRWAENAGLSAEDATNSSRRPGVHPDGID